LVSIALAAGPIIYFWITAKSSADTSIHINDICLATKMTSDSVSLCSGMFFLGGDNHIELMSKHGSLGIEPLSRDSCVRFVRSIACLIISYTVKPDVNWSITRVTANLEWIGGTTHSNSSITFDNQRIWVGGRRLLENDVATNRPAIEERTISETTSHNLTTGQLTTTIDTLWPVESQYYLPLEQNIGIPGILCPSIDNLHLLIGFSDNLEGRCNLVLPRDREGVSVPSYVYVIDSIRCNDASSFVSIKLHVDTVLTLSRKL
jgi:hypothetical protein